MLTAQQELELPLYSILTSTAHAFVFLGIDPSTGIPLEGSFVGPTAQDPTRPPFVPLTTALALLTNAPSEQIGALNMFPNYEAHFRDVFRTLAECMDTAVSARIACNLFIYVMLAIATTSPVLLALVPPHLLSSPRVEKFCFRLIDFLGAVQPAHSIVADFTELYSEGMRAFFPALDNEGHFDRGVCKR